MDCVFCRILAKKASGSLVYEDGLTATFLDIHPVTVGHLLIVPKLHVERFSQLPDEVAAHLFRVARQVLEALETSEIPCEAANIFMSDGRVAGQEVMHCHLHIAPRNRGDGQRMGFKHDQEWPRERLDEVARKIRVSLTENRESEKRNVEESLPQPVLESSRLGLRAFRAEDVGDIYKYASQTGIDQFVPFEAHRSLDDSHTFLEYIHRSTSYDRARLFYVFALEEKATGRVIGSIDFKKTNRFGAQLDYALGVSHWGKGFVTEAAATLRDWGFRTLPELERLQAYCQVENRGSSRVMEKIGMKQEGRREKAYLLKDKLVDLYDYALLRRDWKDLP